MTNGIIKFFNAAKGYGFVTQDGGGPDIFLPSAAIAASGGTAVKQGQRIAFQQAPDVKGPKVVSFEILNNAPAPVPVSSAPQVTVYCRLDTDAAADVIEVARGSGAKLALVDYMAAPPSIDQLKRLAQMVGVAGQSLVRRYDPLFLALQLDDRFIAEQEFWQAIFEHPALINGPVITASGRAAVCKTAAEAQHFLEGDTAKAVAAPKTLSPRIAAMLRGEAVPAVQPAAVAPPQTKKPVAPAVVPPKAATKAQPKAVPAPPAKKPAPKKPEPKKPEPKKPVAKKAAKPAKKTKARK